MSTLRPISLTCAPLLALGLFACGPGGTDPVGASPCTNGIQDVGETGVDCGGSCDPCGAGTCSNNVQDPTETGVDCGGSCPPCVVSGDCDNDILDPGEEDVDCGGPRTPCGQEPTCTDAFDNGDETDIDCGGETCPQCGEGKGCDGNRDCTTGVCDDAIFKAPAASCSNNEKDPDESDIDCGVSCPGCPTGKVCRDHGDCLSDTCVFGICRDPSCTDGLANQDETDVDCGGATCDKCPDENRCRGLSDCASNTCIGGVCKPEGSSAGTCEVEGDCDSGFFCNFNWNESGGAAADWDMSCLVERDGAQPGEACASDEACAGVGCVNGLRSKLCMADDECVGSGAVCASEEFHYDTDGDNLANGLLSYDACLAFDNAGGSCLAHADCPNGKRCTVYLDRNLSGGNLDPDGPYKASGRCEDEVSGGAAEGAQCDKDAECRSGYCGRQGVCTRYCQASSECGPVVVNAAGVLQFRVCSADAGWGGGELGDRTNLVSKSSCVGVLNWHEPSPCDASMLVPFECGVNRGCQLVYAAFGPDVKAKAEFVCLETTDAFGRIGEGCNESSQCMSGTCWTDDNDELGYCTKPCGNDTHCGSSGLTCHQVEIVERKGKYLGNGLSVGYCLR